MKKILFLSGLLFALVITFSLPSFSTAGTKTNPIKVYYGNQELQFDTPPVNINGRIMVPLRSIFEALGANIAWDTKKSVITATKPGTNLEITLNQKTATKNGSTIVMDVPPMMRRNWVLIPLRFVSEAFNTSVNWNPEARLVKISNNTLPSVGSFENLKKLLAEGEGSRANLFREIRAGSVMKSMTKEDAAPAESLSNQAADYSATNIQVQGVDEADIIKTDGTFIYQVNKGRIMITKAFPPEKMEIINSIQFSEKSFYPQEIYVDNRYLVVIGNLFEDIPVPLLKEKTSTSIYPPPYRVLNTVKAIVYDIQNKDNIRQVREVELEGNYVSSRKIESSLYLIANRYLDTYYIMNGETIDASPAFRDSAAGSKYQHVDYPHIRYFPGYVEPNYLMVASIDLNRPEEKMLVNTYLGAGENIYATKNSLYVSVTEYQQAEPDTTGKIMERAQPFSIKTTVYKFALENGKTEYSGKGQVPGTILNQFSMDEQDGYFRIATTSGEIWRSDEQTSKNNIFVLDPNMKITGSLEDLAPGEKIYSVRFMGDRAYMVTFRTVDPLFVIDLKDPKKPEVLGVLKIPGYSDYLHPYDENHIIGFGKETIEISQKNWDGENMGTMAFYQGMKIALFDVSDVTHPVEMFKEIIGDRGTDSELLHNHKALLFSREKNILAFPVTVMEIKDKTAVNESVPPYGEFTFQGAYIYRLDLKNGFQLKGTVTHLTTEDLVKSGYHWYHSNKNVERIIYIGNTLYTVSQSMIKANQMSDLREVGSLKINR